MTMQVQASAPRGGRLWCFARHYLEMVAAMLAGMVTLYPVWLLLRSGAAGADWLHALEAESLAMATAMTVPMVLWMRLRGHAVRLAAEMGIAMYAGFVLLFPLVWWGGLGEMGLMMAGHVLMPVLMLVAMLARRDEYAHAP